METPSTMSFLYIKHKSIIDAKIDTSKNDKKGNMGIYIVQIYPGTPRNQGDEGRINFIYQIQWQRRR